MDNNIPYFYINTTKIISNNKNQLEYIFFEVEIDNLGLVSSSLYESHKKNIYHTFPYRLKIHRIFYNLENQEENQEEEQEKIILNKVISSLITDKYYLCKFNDDEDIFNRFSKPLLNNNIEKIMFGFKKPDDSYVIKIYDLNPSKPYDEKLNWNPKIKIINLLMQEKILKIC